MPPAQQHIGTKLLGIRDTASNSGDILWVCLAKSSSYSMPKFSTPPPLKADLTKGFQAGGGGAEEKKVLDICSPHGILFHDPPALR